MNDQKRYKTGLFGLCLESIFRRCKQLQNTPKFKNSFQNQVLLLVLKAYIILKCPIGVKTTLMPAIYCYIRTSCQ